MPEPTNGVVGKIAGIPLTTVLSLTREGIGLIAALVLCWLVYYGATTALPAEREATERRCLDAIQQIQIEFRHQHERYEAQIEKLRESVDRLRGKN